MCRRVLQILTLFQTKQCHFSHPLLRPGACFSKVPVTFGAQKAVLCLLCRAFKIKFNKIENNTTKLSVNEAKFIGVWDRNCPSIDLVTVLETMLTSIRRNRVKNYSLCMRIYCRIISVKTPVLKKYELVTKASLLRILLKTFEGVTCSYIR